MSSTETPPKNRWSFGKKVFVGMAIASFLVLVLMIVFVVSVTKAAQDQQTALRGSVTSSQSASGYDGQSTDQSLSEPNSDAGSAQGGDTTVTHQLTPDEELQTYLAAHLPSDATRIDHMKWVVNWYCGQKRAGNDSSDVQYAAYSVYYEYWSTDRSNLDWPNWDSAVARYCVGS